MFKDDLDLVQAATSKYGLRLPLVDLGGLKNPTIADYQITIRTGDQQARYIKLPGRPFDNVDSDYQIINPEYGNPPIEELPLQYSEAFGTIVCLSVLEHVINPFEIFYAFYKLLQPGGLLILSTVFSFPKHQAPRDYWRFSDDCLRMLAEQAGLQVLEFGERLKIHGGMGVLEIHTGVPQEIISTYVVARK